MGPGYSYTEFPVVSGTCQADGGEWNTTAAALLESESCEESIDFEVSCEPVNEKPFCNLWTSFLKIFTMLLGEVENQFFANYPIATLMFAMFMFGCVVVLANVLIAIVTGELSSNTSFCLSLANVAIHARLL